MRKNPKNALVVGIEPFGAYRSNPTKWLAKRVNGKTISGHSIHSLVLPSVAFFQPGEPNHGETIVAAAKQAQADAIVCFGIGSDIRGFRIESSGVNWAENAKYLPLEQNNRVLDERKPAKHVLPINFGHWKLKQMRQRFEQEGLELEPDVSESAGHYSCNSMIYRTLLEQELHKLDIPFLFVHASCSHGSVRYDNEFDRKKTLNRNRDLLKALEIILESRKD